MTTFFAKTIKPTLLVLSLSATVHAHTPTSNPPYPNHSGMTNPPSTKSTLTPPTKFPPKLAGINNISIGNVGFNETYHNRTVAEWSLQQINASLPQIYDPYVTDFVYRATSGINALARQQGLLATPVIDDKNINAFAVTGGVIALNTGVILSSDSLDETVSVLAHEIGHLAMKHYERSQDDKNKQLALQLGGLLAAIAASTISGDAAAAAMIGTQTMSAETSAAHSRDHEREADRVGMAIMAQAGFDVHGMPRFFDKLHRYMTLNTAQGAFLPTFFQSHPLSNERLSEAAARAMAYRPASLLDKQDHAHDFDLLYWRIKYLSQANESDFRQAIATSTGAKLAYVAWLADKRRFDDAIQVFEKIDKKYQNEPLYCITLAQIDYEKGDFAKAAATLSACHAIAPERRDLTLYLADTLVQAGQNEQAIALLTPIAKKTPYDLMAQELLKKSYENLSQTAKTNKNTYTAYALKARATKELWHGNYDKALTSLTQAKTVAKNDTALTKLLDDEMTTVRRYRDLKLR